MATTIFRTFSSSQKNPTLAIIPRFIQTHHPHQPRSTTNLFSVSIDLPLLDISYTRNHTICGFYDWLLSLGIMFSRVLSVIACFSILSNHCFCFLKKKNRPYFLEHSQVHSKIEQTVQRVPIYWVSQQVHSCFSVISYGKTQTNLLANPILLPPHSFLAPSCIPLIIFFSNIFSLEF